MLNKQVGWWIQLMIEGWMVFNFYHVGTSKSVIMQFVWQNNFLSLPTNYCWYVYVLNNILFDRKLKILEVYIILNTLASTIVS